jgi:hypothetical protein
MTVAEGALTHAAAGRADFVRRSLWVVAGIPLLALLSIFAPPNRLTETLLVLLALASPWVLAALAWRYGSRYARKAPWAWHLLSALLALLGLAIVAGAVYLVLLGSAFGRA